MACFLLYFAVIISISIRTTSSQILHNSANTTNPNFITSSFLANSTTSVLFNATLTNSITNSSQFKDATVREESSSASRHVTTPSVTNATPFEGAINFTTNRDIGETSDDSLSHPNQTTSFEGSTLDVVTTLTGINNTTMIANVTNMPYTSENNSTAFGVSTILNTDEIAPFRDRITLLVTDTTPLEMRINFTTILVPTDDSLPIVNEATALKGFTTTGVYNITSVDYTVTEDNLTDSLATDGSFPVVNETTPLERMVTTGVYNTTPVEYATIDRNTTNSVTTPVSFPIVNETTSIESKITTGIYKTITPEYTSAEQNIPNLVTTDTLLPVVNETRSIEGMTTTSVYNTTPGDYTITVDNVTALLTTDALLPVVNETTSIEVITTTSVYNNFVTTGSSFPVINETTALEGITTTAVYNNTPVEYTTSVENVTNFVTTDGSVPVVNETTSNEGITTAFVYNTTTVGFTTTVENVTMDTVHYTTPYREMTTFGENISTPFEIITSTETDVSTSVNSSTESVLTTLVHQSTPSTTDFALESTTFEITTNAPNSTTSVDFTTIQNETTATVSLNVTESTASGTNVPQTTIIHVKASTGLSTFPHPGSTALISTESTSGMEITSESGQSTPVSELNSTVNPQTTFQTDHVESTIVTTVKVTTDVSVLPTTFPSNLNTSSEYDEYWVRTVIDASSDNDLDVSSPEFIQEMEQKLAELYNEGQERERILASGSFMAYKRKKRYAQYEDVTIQMTKTRRGSIDAQRYHEVGLVYYMAEGPVTALVPNFTDPQRVVYLMSLFDIQEVAIALDFPIIVKAEIYDPPPVPKEPMYWIIGAVLGGVVLIAGLVWCSLFIYFKYTRPPPKRSPRGSVSSSRSRQPYVSGGTRSLSTSPTPQPTRKPRKKPVSESDTSYKSHENGVSKSKSGATVAPVVAKESAPVQRCSRPTHRPPPSKEAFEDPVYAVPQKRAKSKDPHRTFEDIVSESEPGSVRSTSQMMQPSRPTAKKRSKSKKKGKENDSVHAVTSSVHEIRLPPLQQQLLVAVLPPEAPDEQQQLDESMRQRAAIERKKNKDRQRKKRRGSPSKSLESSRDAERRQIDAVLDPQSELSEKSKKKPKSSKSKKRDKKDGMEKEESERNVEMNDMYDPVQRASQYVPIRARLHTASEEPKYEDDGPRLESDSEGDECLDEARTRMHALLDDAFQLGASKHSGDDASKAERGELQSSGMRHTPMQLKSPRSPQVHQAWSPYTASDLASQLPQAPPHPVAGRGSTNRQATTGRRRPKSAHPGYINPAYLDQPIELGTRSIPSSEILATEPADPIWIVTRTPGQARTALQPPDYTSVAMDARIFAPRADRPAPPQRPAPRRPQHDQYELDSHRPAPRRPQYDQYELDSHRPRSGSVEAHGGNVGGQDVYRPRASSDLQNTDMSGLYSNGQLGTGGQVTAPYLSQPTETSLSRPHDSLAYTQSTLANGTSNKTGTSGQLSFVHGSAVGHIDEVSEHLRGRKQNGDENELEIVTRAVKPGSSAAPLVESIRQELRRLGAAGAPKTDAIQSFSHA